MGVMIEGVELIPLKQISVPQGNVYHALKSTDKGYSGFGEVYFSQIKSGEVKGWKRHNRMPLNIVVPVGIIKFVIFDDRPGSPSNGEFFEVCLSPVSNYQRLYVAPGLWMAFKGVSPTTSMLVDIIPEPHDPQEADKKELYEINYCFD